MLESSDYAVCNKSRQIGVSHSTAGLLNIWGAFRGETTTIISVGEREAIEVLDKVKLHSDVLVKHLGSNMARRTGRDSATDVGFASGGRVLALPSTGGRSFTGNVYLDEFAYYLDRKKAWDAAMAVTLLGFKARISSTPNGVDNEFHSVCTDAEFGKNFAQYQITIHDAIACGYPVDLKKCWTIAHQDERLFGQLFECSFLDGLLQYIPTAMVDACAVDDLYTWQGEYYGGLDIGRSNDLTVLIVVRKGPDGVRRVQWTGKCKRTNSQALDDLVDYAFRRFDLTKLGVDATGLGIFPADQMQQKYGEWAVEPVTFTLQSKETLATGLYDALANRTANIPEKTGTLPEDDFAPGEAEALHREICSIKREVTAAGNVRYDTPRSAQGHGDRAWAFALALHVSADHDNRRFETPGA